MKIVRSIRHHASMGKYEWAEIGAEAELTTDDIPDLAADPVTFMDQLADVLAAALEPELKKLRAATGDENSYAHHWKD